jgi:hypothetical protein
MASTATTAATTTTTTATKTQMKTIFFQRAHTRDLNLMQ